MKKSLKLQTGQGLLETIFAIGILLMVVAAILALTVSALLGQKASEAQIIANNLGREAIEVVRNIRDSNWLLGSQQWDLGLTDTVGQNITALAVFSKINGWQLSFFPATQIADKDLLYISPSGVYGHDPQGSLPSIYKRHLVLESICQSKDLTGNYSIETIQASAGCNINEQKIGIKIKAIIDWQERGRQQRVILDDLIYEWK
ncbi:MAG: hypothetical protein WCW26_05175 [Candidatus Buchananbacteria bacterium]